MQVGSFGTKPGASRNAGFTIIELLVVMAIIGILAAITFPVFVKAKEGARVSQCLSNMRQLGTSLTAYLDSYDTRFPAAASWGSPSYWAQPRFGSQKTIQELLKPYVRNGMNKDANGLYTSPSVFACPSDTGIPGTRSVNGVPPNKPICRYAGCSYEYYAANQVDWQVYDSHKPGTMQAKSWTGLSPEVAVDYGLQRIGAPLSKIMCPTRKAVLGDTWYWHVGDRVPADPDSREPILKDAVLAYRNTLFADCHAARVSGVDHDQARIQPLSPWHSMSEVSEE